jgi:hypothetical protein
LFLRSDCQGTHVNRAKLLALFALIAVTLGWLEKTMAQKMVVFLVHGYIGDPSSFCDLNLVLQKSFGDQISVVPIRYSTFRKASENLPARDELKKFVREVNQQISSHYKNNGLSLNLPYAVVAHSLGGLIFSKWLKDCYYEKKSHCGPETQSLPNFLNTFITLGTPFHGSPLASRLTEGSLREVLVSFFKKTTPIDQLYELSMGSDLVEEAQEHLQVLFERVKRQETQFVSIGADIGTSFFSYYVKALQMSPKGFWNKSEYDGAIHLPAAVPLTLQDYERDPELFRYVTFHPVKGTHSMGPGSIACHKESDSENKHVLQLIKIHLARALGMKLSSSEIDVFSESGNLAARTISSFISYLDVILPENFYRSFPTRLGLIDEKDLMVETKSPEIRHLFTESRLLTKTHGQKKGFAKQTPQIRFFISGRFQQANAVTYSPQYPHLNPRHRGLLNWHINNPWVDIPSVRQKVAPGLTSRTTVAAKEKNWDNQTCFEGRIRYPFSGEALDRLPVYADSHLQKNKGFIEHGEQVRVVDVTGDRASGEVNLLIERSEADYSASQERVWIDGDQVRLYRPCVL